MKIIYKIGLPALGAAALLLAPSPIAALPNAHANPAAASAAHSPTTTVADSNTGTTKSQAARQKACENHQKAIDNIMGRIVTRGQKQLDLFGTIADRVQAFAVTKDVPAASYSDQLAAVTAAKDAATNDLAAMKTSQTIDCTSTTPKAAVTTFQTNLKTEIGDLKTYKTAVKDLIVAVKKALGNTGATGTGTSDTTKATTSTTGGEQ